MLNKRTQRKQRHHRLRAKVIGTASKPRMSVFRSINHIYVQLIDDAVGKTLVATSSKEIKSKGKKSDVATEVGKVAAEKAKAAGIKSVVFDRSGNKYHGRIKQLADGARSAGLEF